VSLATQTCWLLLLAIPVACVSWTVTHEELFAEVREWCTAASQHSASMVTRKFFYLFTCEYCFSHYIAGGMVWLTHFHLLVVDWRGLVFAWFSLVWVANIYMSLFGWLRLDVKHERVAVQAEELAVAERKTLRRHQGHQGHSASREHA